MSVPLRRSSRKRKFPEVSNTSQSMKCAGNTEEEARSCKDELAEPNTDVVQGLRARVTLVRLRRSTSSLKQKSDVMTTENKSPVKVIQNPINFYGKSSQNLSFSEEETTLNAAVALRNIVKYERKGNRQNRILLNSNSVLERIPKGCKKAKDKTKPHIKKNPQKFSKSKFMKKSLLENLQPEMLNKVELDTIKVPPKRKFFSSSTKEKCLQMTTTLFGKQRISAASVLNKPTGAVSGNGVIPLGPMKFPDQSCSSLSLKNMKSARSSIITPVLSQKEITDDKMPSIPEKNDLRRIDQKLPGKNSPVSKNLQSLDNTTSSIISGDSTDDLMRSNGSDLIVSDLEDLHIESPSAHVFIQHYHYSPPSNDNVSFMHDLSVENLNSSFHKPCPATPSPIIKNSCKSISQSPVGGLVGSPPLSSSPRIQLFSSPLSMTAKTLSSKNHSKSAWPIRYSREKENLSNLKSKLRSSKNLLPAFKNSCLKDIDGKEQLIIDAGQNKIGAQMCTNCGMLYNPDSAEDVGLHVKFHNTVITNLRFQGWKKERVVREFMDGRVLVVLPDDPKYALKKVSDVKAIMDSNLGFHEKAEPDRHTMQVYFFVMQKKIVGCLIAEAIKRAFRVIPSEANSPLACSTSPEPAVCGINRIWTLATQRRCQVASRLIDCMRTCFYFGCEVTIDQIAFSDPTPDGRQFAATYTSSENFLVYK